MMRAVRVAQPASTVFRSVRTRSDSPRPRWCSRPGDGRRYPGSNRRPRSQTGRPDATTPRLPVVRRTTSLPLSRTVGCPPVRFHARDPGSSRPPHRYRCVRLPVRTGPPPTRTGPLRAGGERPDPVALLAPGDLRVTPTVLPAWTPRLPTGRRHLPRPKPVAARRRPRRVGDGQRERCLIRAVSSWTWSYTRRRSDISLRTFFSAYMTVVWSRPNA